ncbi:hypothetical protein [Botrimarina mediterranea]|uniref:hypothetical protein n=1 Tax=Botrimarina mediterranea TaxID=2528022 RepID=UPI00118B7397|nr:hypothetical protein K2D_34910 [Planctomycetes bacterium K2D]
MNTQPPSDNSNDPADDAPQRRKERGAAADGSGEFRRAESERSSPSTPEAEPTRRSEEHREEVVGQGSGETAGGSPAIAKGDNPAAQRSADDAALAFDPAILNGGGGLSNTPPQKTTLGGEDYLTVNFYLEYESFGGIREQLERAREAALRGSDANTLQLGDVVGLVSPGGVKVGARDKGFYVPYQVRTDHGVKLLIADRATPHRTHPSVQISAPSVPMMRLGFAGVWGLFHYLIEQLGATIVANKLSRVDPCLDLPGTPVTTFTEPYSNGWLVTRAKSRSRHQGILPATSYASGQRDTGFCVGKSPLLLRIYDKLLDAMRDPVKMEIMATSRWLGIPDVATRIEFQLGRGRLKKLGVDTVEDWIAKRADVVQYLTASWFRLTSGPVDRRHSDRTPNHPAWEAAATLFAECYGAPVGADLTPLPTLAIDPSQRVNVAVGVLKTAIVEFGYPIATNPDFLAVATDLIAAIIADRNMAEEIVRRTIEKGLGGMGLG